MAAVTVSFRWLDILEKEFDKAFVDLELLSGEQSEYIDIEDCSKVQNRLEALSSCFAQLTHKAQTIFQSNAKLEAELIHLRKEVTEGKALYTISQQQNKQLLNQLNEYRAKEKIISADEEEKKDDDLENKSDSEATETESPLFSATLREEELKLISGENAALRRLIIALQGELCGARLAAKYLDKELAGRIQQLQLLGREVRWQQDHDKLWRQLEAEINLHRHKTVVRACRANIPSQNGMQSSVMTTQEKTLPRPAPGELCREITIEKDRDRSLGMSVTGGKEHGVPIVVSGVHPNTPASDCGKIFVGDAIMAVNGSELRQMSHTDAVKLLSQPCESITLYLMFVTPEDDDTQSLPDDPFAFKYRMFDDDVVSVSSSVVPSYNRSYPRDGLSNASVESVRGSCEDLLDTLDLETEVGTTEISQASSDNGGSCPSTYIIDDMDPSNAIFDSTTQYDVTPNVSNNVSPSVVSEIIPSTSLNDPPIKSDVPPIITDVPLFTSSDIPLSTSSVVPLSTSSDVPLSTLDVPVSTSSDVLLSTTSDVPHSTSSDVPLSTAVSSTSSDIPVNSIRRLSSHSSPSNTRDYLPLTPVHRKHTPGGATRAYPSLSSSVQLEGSVRTRFIPTDLVDTRESSLESERVKLMGEKEPHISKVLSPVEVEENHTETVDTNGNATEKEANTDSQLFNCDY